MAAYVVRRVLHGIVVLFGVSIIVFLLMHLAGDPVAVLLPLDAPPEQIEAFRKEMGFDQPLPVQYVRFMLRAVRGDFGYSYHYRRDAFSIVVERMPATLKMAGLALAFSLLVSIPAGIFAALKKGSVFDVLVRVGVLLGQAIPGFWLALMLIILFGVKLRWLPVSGAGGFKNLVLPAVVTGSFSMATITRLLRCNLVETMGETFIQVARGKGVPQRLIVTRHALKNAAIPTVTVIGMQLGWLLSGSVITEAIFAYPGMGRLAVTAIGYRDVPVIQSFVLITASIVVIVNLGVDVLYSWLDPRIRLNE